MSDFLIDELRLLAGTRSIHPEITVEGKAADEIERLRAEAATARDNFMMCEMPARELVERLEIADKRIEELERGMFFTHESVDAFWRAWNEIGEPHTHGVYESTWAAFRAAIKGKPSGHIITTAQIDAAWGAYIEKKPAGAVLRELHIVICEECGGSGHVPRWPDKPPYTDCPDCEGHGWKAAAGETGFGRRPVRWLTFRWGG